MVAHRAGIPVVQHLHDYEFISASWRDHSGGWRDRDESRRSIRALNDATFVVRRALHARAVDAWIANSRYVGERHAAVGIQATVLPCFVEPAGASAPGFSERRGAVFVGRLH